METLLQDLRYALRALLKSPGFAAVAILTLALGIGANSAIFSVVNGVVLRPLPFERPEELVRLRSHLREGPIDANSAPNFLEFQQEARSLAGLAAYNNSQIALTGHGDPAMLSGAGVSAEFFDVLGARPLLGRAFRTGENEPGATDLVVLGHGLWTQRFGADREIVGKTILLNGQSRTVVGVMPPGFAYPEAAQLWVPLVYDESFRTDENRGAFSIYVIGRLAPGTGAAQASAEVERLARSAAERFPDLLTGTSASVVPLHDATVGEIRTPLLVLLGAVGFVLLIACANVANLLLARAATRETELAVRTALGATRGRMVRQLLTESVLLALLGGALGLILALWGTDLLVSLQPADVPRLGEVRVDGAAVLFTLGISVLTGFLFGLIPALQVGRGDLGGTLRDGGRGTVEARRGARLRSALVVAETAMAVVLLAGAGLLIHSFGRLVGVDPGFRAERTLTFRLSAPASRYAGNPEVAGFYQQMVERLEALPGVRAVGAASSVPLGRARMRTSMEVDGREPTRPGQRNIVDVRMATPGYFETLAVPLRQGRLFAGQDRAGAPPVVLIGETTARRFFPGEDPIGKRIELGADFGSGALGGEIVGIVGDTKLSTLQEETQPTVYVAQAQFPLRTLDLVVRAAGDPLRLAGAITREVHALDPEMPVVDLRSMDQVLAAAVSQPRFYMLLLGIFAAIALALAAIGIFGVMSYAVTQRRREMGIRVALGARPGAVVWMVVARALLLTAGGLAVGMAGALVLTRLIGGLLFGVAPTDPATLAGVALVLTTVAGVAAWLPARRAAGVDPIVALRAD